MLKERRTINKAFAPTLRCLSWMKVSKWCLSNQQALNHNFLAGLVKFRTDEDKIVAFKACACRQHFARFGERGGRTLQQAKFELIRQVTHDLLLFYLDWIYEYVILLSFYWSFVENIKSIYLQLTGHENYIGCNKSASNLARWAASRGSSQCCRWSFAIIVIDDRGCYFFSAYPTKEDFPRFIFSDFSCNITSNPERVAKRARALIVERTGAAHGRWHHLLSIFWDKLYLRVRR